MEDIERIRQIEAEIGRCLSRGSCYEIEGGKVVEIDFSYLELNILPESLGEFTALTYLNLGNNGFASFPESLGNLSALTYLDLGNNRLASLPSWLGNLTALTELQADQSAIDASPSMVAALRARGVVIVEY